MPAKKKDAGILEHNLDIIPCGMSKNPLCWWHDGVSWHMKWQVNFIWQVPWGILYQCKCSMIAFPIKWVCRASLSLQSRKLEKWDIDILHDVDRWHLHSEGGEVSLHARCDAKWASPGVHTGTEAYIGDLLEHHFALHNMMMTMKFCIQKNIARGIPQLPALFSFFEGQWGVDMAGRDLADSSLEFHWWALVCIVWCHQDRSAYARLLCKHHHMYNMGPLLCRLFLLDLNSLDRQA